MDMATPTIGAILLLSFLFIAAHAGQDSCSPCPSHYDCASYPPGYRYKIVAYVQENARGECQTVHQVASTPVACRCPTNLSAVDVDAGNPMREGHNADSKPLGRLQERAAQADYIAYFSCALYNGTLYMKGDIRGDPKKVDELSIYTGTGDFRNAKGEANRIVYSIDGKRKIIIARWKFYFCTQE